MRRKNEPPLPIKRERSNLSCKVRAELYKDARDAIQEADLTWWQVVEWGLEVWLARMRAGTQDIQPIPR